VGINGGESLLTALSTGGGHEIADMRHIVDALLNSTAITGYPISRSALVAAMVVVTDSNPNNSVTIQGHTISTLDQLANLVEGLEDPCPLN